MKQKKHNHFLNLLTEMAKVVEPVAHSRHAACIVYKNEISSFGINQRKSHPFQQQYSKNNDAIYLHAEIDAIKNALRKINQKQLSKSTMYVIRIKHNEKKQMVWGNSKPCIGCARAIAEFDIKNVIYTAEKAQFLLL